MRVFSPRESIDSTPRHESLSRNRRAGLLGLALAASLMAAGCGSSEDNDDGWYTLVLVPSAGTDPFNDPAAENLYLRIDDRDHVLVVDREFPLDAGDFVLDDVPTGEPVYFIVEVRDGLTPRNVLARGESGLLAVEKDTHTTVTIVLSPPT